MLRKYRAKYAASRSSSESSEQPEDSASSGKLGGDALKYNAIGRYTVESKELLEVIDSYDNMTLNITKTDKDGFVAFFSISGITRVMLLDTDEEELYFRWLDKRYEADDVSEEESSNTEASSEMLDNENQERGETPVKSEDHQDPNDKSNHLCSIPPSGLKRESTSSPTPDVELHPKRRNVPTITTSKHDTLFLMWRGRATHERGIQLDPDGDFIGHIKFLDEECSRYEGVFYDSWTNQDITLKGNKVSQDPGPPEENWAKLSWRAWEVEEGRV